MKRVISLAFLLFSFALAVNGQNTKKDKVVKKMGDEVCQCLENTRTDTISSYASYKAVLLRCMMPAMLNNMEELKKAFNLKTLDSEGGQKVGYEVGLYLATNCKIFMDMAVKYSSELLVDGDDVPPPPPQESNIVSTTGFMKCTLLRTEKNAMLTFVMKEPDGSETRIWWIEHFKGDTELISNPDALNGKQVEVEWKEKEIFLPGEKKYIKVKMATRIEPAG